MSAAAAIVAQRAGITPAVLGSKLTLDLRGDVLVAASGSDVTSWTDQDQAAAFAQGTGSLRPDTATLGGRAAVAGDGTDDYLEAATPTLGSFLASTAFWFAFTFRYDVAATDTHNNASQGAANTVWESHGIFADHQGFFGFFTYLDGSDKKIAVLFYDAATSYACVVYAGTLTVGNTYYAEGSLSSGTLSIRINAATPDTVSTARVISTSGLSTAKLRACRGNRSVTAGVTLGDAIACNAMPSAAELAIIRKLWFSERRTGVTTP
jgi:hypothetical protein